MNLIKETLNLTNFYLKVLNDDAKYLLAAKDRVQLYRSYGPSRLDKYFENEQLKIKVASFDFLPSDSEFDGGIEKSPENLEKVIEERFANFTLADFAQSWLAILTVEKVLFVWEDWDWELYSLDNHPKEDARKITEVSKELLQKTVSFKTVFEKFCNKFNFGLNIDNWVPYQVYCVYEAAYFALDFIIGDDLSLENVVFGHFDSYDEAEYSKDFATSALKAYTAIDPNPLGKIKLWPEEFDAKKRLEFWEWWLTEAIPQAWELAQNSTNS